MLAENGLGELAYEAMNKRDYPSFGHWIDQGATTTWEQWNGENSRNHPMFGGSLTWFYRKLTGLNADPSQPGYRHIVFRPQPVSQIDWAKYATATHLRASVGRLEQTGRSVYDDGRSAGRLYGYGVAYRMRKPLRPFARTEPVRKTGISFITA